MESIFRPVFFNLSVTQDKIHFDALIKEPFVHVYDTIEDQLRELYKVRNPSIARVEDIEYVAQPNLKEYGMWVFYPWTNRLIHVLPEDEFIEVRTNRNALKITTEEQKKLKEKKVGIIGLSVGQSIALTMAMERACGSFRLADFDTIELSNLNRIRTSIHNINLNKAVAAAREIAEIDPYIEVEIFDQGLVDDNMEAFLIGNSKLDALVEVCDSLDVKIKCRMEARKSGIPVIMETNDKCMLDIERFDKEPHREILHGLVSEEDLFNFPNLESDKKLELVFRIVDGHNLSERMKNSFSALGKTLRAWPQLASSVTLGGAVTTDAVRKILLEEDVPSGRRYIDIDVLLNKELIHN